MSNTTLTSDLVSELETRLARTLNTLSTLVDAAEDTHDFFRTQAQMNTFWAAMRNARALLANAGREEPRTHGLPSNPAQRAAAAQDPYSDEGWKENKPR